MGKKHEPLNFLAWVAQIPPETHAAFPETRVQLVRTFYHLTATYGLRLEDPAGFEAKAQAMGEVRVPCLYLPCTDRPGLWLAFDWAIWIRASGYLMES